MHRGGCLELYYCNMVEWFWWDSSLILTTVGLVIWPVKVMLEMTYNVSSGTLRPYTTLPCCYAPRLLTEHYVISVVGLSTSTVTK